MGNKVWYWVNRFKEIFKDFSPDTNSKHLLGTLVVSFLVLINVGYQWSLALLIAAWCALFGSANDVYGFLREKEVLPTLKEVIQKAFKMLSKKNTIKEDTNNA